MFKFALRTVRLQLRHLRPCKVSYQNNTCLILPNNKRSVHLCTYSCLSDLPYFRPQFHQDQTIYTIYTLNTTRRAKGTMAFGFPGPWYADDYEFSRDGDHQQDPGFCTNIVEPEEKPGWYFGACPSPSMYPDCYPSTGYYPGPGCYPSQSMYVDVRCGGGGCGGCGDGDRRGSISKSKKRNSRAGLYWARPKDTGKQSSFWSRTSDGLTGKGPDVFVLACKDRRNRMKEMPSRDVWTQRGYWEDENDGDMPWTMRPGVYNFGSRRYEGRPKFGGRKSSGRGKSGRRGWTIEDLLRESDHDEDIGFGVRGGKVSGLPKPLVDNCGCCPGGLLG